MHLMSEAEHQIFERQARTRLADLWNIPFPVKPPLVRLRNGAAKAFDLVSPGGTIVGDIKWFTHSNNPGAKIDNVGFYVWLLKEIPNTERVFLLFNQNAKEAVERDFLRRFRQLASPVEFYYFDETLTTLYQF